MNDSNQNPLQDPRIKSELAGVRALGQIKLVWLAIMSSVGVFAFLSSTRPPEQTPEPGTEVIVQMFWAMAVVVGLIGKFLPPFIAKKSPNPAQGLIAGHVIRYALFESAGLFVFMNIFVYKVPFNTGVWGFVAVFILFLLNPPRPKL